MSVLFWPVTIPRFHINCTIIVHHIISYQSVPFAFYYRSMMSKVVELLPSCRRSTPMRSSTSTLVGESQPLPNHHSPLSFATKTGNLDDVRALIDAKAPVNMVNCMGHMAIMYSHDLDITKALVQAGADVVAPTEYRTVLNMACKTRKFDIIEYLVSQGADVNLADRYGRTPLMSVFDMDKTIESSSSRQRDTELPAIVDFLISAGARVDAVDQYGDSALTAAVRYKGNDRDTHLAAVKKLVDAGGVRLVNIQNKRKLTSLCYVESVAVAQILVSAGADVNLCMKGDQSPLSRACLNNNPDLVRFFLDSGANIRDVNVHDQRFVDVVFQVVEKRYIRVLLHLIDAKANVDVVSTPPGKYTQTPLIHAIFKQNAAEVAMLLDGGANARAYVHRSTALMIASGGPSANPNIVRMLLEAGAIEDINEFHGKSFETAYQIAEVQSVIDVLVAAGCNTRRSTYW
jgi:serine/threonine-protein phosphatase 6 regulatory ankyrin repeat subunit A